MVGLSQGPELDPRQTPRPDGPAFDSQGGLRPAVAGGLGGSSNWLVGGGAVLLGLLVFLWLSSHRTQAPHDLNAAQAQTAAVAPAPAPPPELAALEAQARGAVPPPPPAPPVLPLAIAAAPPQPPPAARPTPAAPSPVLVVDLADAGAAASAPAEAAKGSASGQAADGKSAAASAMNGDEQFAARVETAQQPDTARATVLRGRSHVVAQGAIIPAVLETALDSDLPGFARAVVSRDVRSFDGSQVLIPRGSRLIGEYRNAAMLGQSRAFVIWTRVLRPDGVSVQIGSPATDPLGRAGLSGSVDHHFFERFGGAILLSVVNAGVTALAGSPSTEVVIGSPQAASGIASSVQAFAPADISPTIKVPQGAPIRVFVARDLDFWPVQGREP